MVLKSWGEELSLEEIPDPKSKYSEAMDFDSKSIAIKKSITK